MLTLKLTQTMDVDIWNFWHYALVAAFVELLTGNIVLSLIVAMLNFAIVLVIADNFVDGLEETGRASPASPSPTPLLLRLRRLPS